MVFGILGVASLGTGCERVEPAPENDIRFQATGHVVSGTGVERKSRDAILLIRQRPQGALSLSLHDKISMAVIDTGTLAANALDLSQYSAPLESAIDDTDGDDLNDKLSIRQTLRVSNEVEGLGSARSEHATFEREVTRWFWYSAGYLEHGTSGRVWLRISRANGGTELFEGATTTEPVRQAVGTLVQGQIRGDTSMGGGAAAKLALSIPTGAGALSLWDRNAYAFSFNPRRDILDPRGEVNFRTASANYVEVSDDFYSKVQVSHFAMGLGTGGGARSAKGEGTIEYNLTLAVDRQKILVVGSAAISLALTARDTGERARFVGENRAVSVELDW